MFDSIRDDIGKEVKKAKKLIGCGRYEFFITKYLDKKDDKELVTSKGNKYVQLVVSVFNQTTGEGCDIYVPIFGSENVAEVLDAIGYDYREGEKLTFSHLKGIIGRDGKCFVGISEPKPGSKYDASNSIKCFIQQPKESILSGATVTVNSYSQGKEETPF
jgi:hypothetical protein